MKQFPEKYITANNKTYLIRSFNENDKDNYIKTYQKTSDLETIYNNSDFCRYFLANVPDENELIFSITERSTDAYCGFCNLRNIHPLNPEVGIRLMPEYQRIGIGTQVLPVVMRFFKNNHPSAEFTARAYNDNIGSRRLLKKLGASEIGTEMSEYEQCLRSLQKLSGLPPEIQAENSRFIVIYKFNNN